MLQRPREVVRRGNECYVPNNRQSLIKWLYGQAQRPIYVREALNGISKAVSCWRNLLRAQADVIGILQEVFEHRDGFRQEAFLKFSSPCQSFDGPVNCRKHFCDTNV